MTVEMVGIVVYAGNYGAAQHYPLSPGIEKPEILFDEPVIHAGVFLMEAAVGALPVKKEAVHIGEELLHHFPFGITAGLQINVYSLFLQKPQH